MESFALEDHYELRKVFLGDVLNVESPREPTPTVLLSTGVLCGLTGFMLLQELTGAGNKVCLMQGCIPKSVSATRG